MGRTATQADCIDLVGHAQILMTAPFFPGSNPLDVRPHYRLPDDGRIDAAGRLAPAYRSLDLLSKGSLTYGNPHMDSFEQFTGTDALHAELASAVDLATGQCQKVSVTGTLFPDGYGSVAIRILVPEGWGAAQQERFIEAFGPSGRESVGEVVRTMMLPVLAELACRCGQDDAHETMLPYFNLTYVARTNHPRPGRATLPDEFRQLVYPRSPAPIASDSPWSDEFFYAGYAYNLLASAEPQRTLDQLELLLLHLDVLFARLDQTAAAADRSIREHSHGDDIDFLVDLETRLRANYHGLVRPTFSYDYHVLMLRDSLLSAWGTDQTRERTETLLLMARQAVERELAAEQAARVSRVNLVVTILTVLSVISTAEAAVELWKMLNP